MVLQIEIKKNQDFRNLTKYKSQENQPPQTFPSPYHWTAAIDRSWRERFKCSDSLSREGNLYVCSLGWRERGREGERSSERRARATSATCRVVGGLGLVGPKGAHLPRQCHPKRRELCICPATPPQNPYLLPLFIRFSSPHFSSLSLSVP